MTKALWHYWGQKIAINFFKCDSFGSNKRPKGRARPYSFVALCLTQFGSSHQYLIASIKIRFFGPFLLLPLAPLACPWPRTFYVMYLYVYRVHSRMHAHTKATQMHPLGCTDCRVTKIPRWRFFGARNTMVSSEFLNS